MIVLCFDLLPARKLFTLRQQLCLLLRPQINNPSMGTAVGAVREPPLRLNVWKTERMAINAGSFPDSRLESHLE